MKFKLVITIIWLPHCELSLHVKQYSISTSLWCLCISAHWLYARCCSNYIDFLSRHRALVARLLSQGYKVNRLSNTFKKFYSRHTDLVGQYKKSVCQMFADSISRCIIHSLYYQFALYFYPLLGIVEFLVLFYDLDCRKLQL